MENRHDCNWIIDVNTVTTEGKKFRDFSRRPAPNISIAYGKSKIQYIQILNKGHFKVINY